MFHKQTIWELLLGYFYFLPISRLVIHVKRFLYDKKEIFDFVLGDLWFCLGDLWFCPGRSLILSGRSLILSWEIFDFIYLYSNFTLHGILIAPEGSFVVSPVNVTAVWFSIFVMFSFSVSRFFPFPDFSRFPKNSENGNFCGNFFVVFVAAAGGCLVEEKEWYDLLWERRYCFSKCLYFESFYVLTNLTKWQSIS